MCKCETCYYLFLDSCSLGKELIQDGECDSFLIKCSHCELGSAGYIYQEEGYCRDCLFEELGIEGYQTVTHYYRCDEYLGSDEDDTDLEILQRVDKTIQEAE